MKASRNAPNVWLIVTDQQRWDTLGCYGSKVVETAHLDYFASIGTVFNNAYSCTPSCIPARASLLTGQDPWNVGILGMGDGQGPAQYLENTLPETLGKNGYQTHCVGKLHVHPQRSLQGFDYAMLDESGRELDPKFESDYMRWFKANRPGECDRHEHGIGWNSWTARPWHLPEFLHPTAWTARESVHILRRRDPTRPFFLKTSFARPHSPYDAPPFYFDLYNREKDIPPPEIGDWAAIHDVPIDAANPDAWHGKRQPHEIRRARAGYYGNIHFIDHQIGHVMHYMNSGGLLDNTLIIFISDHGDMMGDHHLWRKTYAYEGSAHIPFIVTLPRAMRGAAKTHVNAPVCLQDVMPTILDACGVDIPDSVDGKSVLPLIRNSSTTWREFVHGEHCACYHADNEMQYLTDGKWKYIWFPQTGAEQLFHLENDRYENQDLAGDKNHHEILMGWRKKLIDVLEPRQAGLVMNGELIRQKGRQPLVSPHYQERLERHGVA